jgi:hypothetical protein
VTIIGDGEPFGAALAFVETPLAVEAVLPAILLGLPEDGLLWFAYRKGLAAKATGLSRDVGWGPVYEAGYQPVRSIAFDAYWTGLRFREAGLVKAWG